MSHYGPVLAQCPAEKLVSVLQSDMLPQHPVNIMQLFSERFENEFSKEQHSSLRMILGSKHVGAILNVLM